MQQVDAIGSQSRRFDRIAGVTRVIQGVQASRRLRMFCRGRGPRSGDAQIVGTRRCPWTTRGPAALIVLTAANGVERRLERLVALHESGQLGPGTISPLNPLLRSVHYIAVIEIRSALAPDQRVVKSPLHDALVATGCGSRHDGVAPSIRPSVSCRTPPPVGCQPSLRGSEVRCCRNQRDRSQLRAGFHAEFADAFLLVCNRRSAVEDPTSVTPAPG